MVALFKDLADSTRASRDAADLKAVWARVNAAAKRGDISVTMRATLNDMKDARKKELSSLDEQMPAGWGGPEAAEPLEGPCVVCGKPCGVRTSDGDGVIIFRHLACDARFGTPDALRQAGEDDV
jgi:hypothetical protein